MCALLADSDYLAEATAAFLMHDDTEPPLTIGICGRWGTGAPNLLLGWISTIKSWTHGQQAPIGWCDGPMT